MKNKDWERDDTTESVVMDERPERASSFPGLKKFFSSKLHRAADTLAEKATPPEVSPGIAQIGKQAAEWLDQSAEIVQQFNPEEITGRIRDAIKENPGRSLLIAGAAGMLIGYLFRRR